MSLGLDSKSKIISLLYIQIDRSNQYSKFSPTCKWSQHSQHKDRNRGHIVHECTSVSMSSHHLIFFFSSVTNTLFSPSIIIPLDIAAFFIFYLGSSVAFLFFFSLPVHYSKGSIQTCNNIIYIICVDTHTHIYITLIKV